MQQKHATQKLVAEQLAIATDIVLWVSERYLDTLRGCQQLVAVLRLVIIHLSL